MAFWVSPARLRARGILGMNRRNIDYIGRCNDRHRFPLVDDKLRTKLLAEESGVPTPELITTLRSQFEVRQLAARIGQRQGFVIKPAKGSSGKGIMVITAREGDSYFKASGKRVSSRDLERHVSNILSGLYSLGGSPDSAIVEGRIESSEYFSQFCYEGIPDVRVVVYRGYPVMSMIRLSTAASDGKANLHQGAIGVGIDIATGNAVRAIQFDRPCTRHPDTGAELAGLQIPDWHDLLQMAAACYEMTGLGYLGVDLAIDRESGPMLLELNARPGLSIQMANAAGLTPRLRMVDRADRTAAVAERVSFAIEHFAAR